MTPDLARLGNRLATGAELDAADRAAIAALLQAAATRLAGIAARKAGRDERDRLIGELADCHLNNLEMTAQAARVARLARAYRSAGWLRDRRHAVPPEHLAGRPEELLWRAFIVCKRFPMSERQIFTILKKQQCIRMQNKTRAIA